ncbi:MAG: T9SS type A sorting domain-containing protein [Saprospiraceae bacterium]
MRHIKIFLLFLVPALLSGQTFSKLFDENDFLQGFVAAAETEEGNLVLSGSNIGHSWKDFFLWNITLDTYGDTLYTRKITFGDSAAYTPGRNTLVKNGGGYFLGGTYNDYSNNETDACLIKLNDLGERIWHKKFGGARIDIWDCMLRAQDDNLIMAGYSSSFGDPSWGNAYIVKTDTNGEIIWQKSFGQNNFPERIFAVDTTADGGFVFSGVQGYDGSQDIFLIKTNSAGDQLWKRLYGFPQADDNTFPRIRTLKNGNYLLTTALIPNGNFHKAYMACVSPTGAKLWEKYYPGAEADSWFGFSTELPNGDLVISGTVLEFDTVFNSNFWVRGTLTKTDATGNLIWQRKYYTQPNHSNYFFAMTPVSDGGFLMYGFAYHDNNNRHDAWAVKVDSFGCLEPGCQTVPVQEPGEENTVPISVWPNPVITTLQIESPEVVLLGLRLSDLQGRVLEDIQFFRTDQVKDYCLPLAAYPAGVYILALRTDKGWVTKKVVRG